MQIQSDVKRQNTKTAPKYFGQRDRFLKVLFVHQSYFPCKFYGCIYISRFGNLFYLRTGLHILYPSPTITSDLPLLGLSIGLNALQKINRHVIALTEGGRICDDIAIAFTEVSLSSRNGCSESLKGMKCTTLFTQCAGLSDRTKTIQ